MIRFLEPAFRKRWRLPRCLISYALCLLSMAAAGSAELQAATDVLTRHYDGQRTGWNPQETILSLSSLQSQSFGLIRTVQVDDDIYVQPLIVTDQPISGAQGNRTVVYVATEANTIYAIDASTGEILLTRNLGPPVPPSVSGCNFNRVNIGIDATPVIDRSTGQLYVIAYTFDNEVPSYRLHALDLSTLADTLDPVVVTASQTLSDGTIYTFDPTASRQRAALLEANGNIYAAFASFCDFSADRSRGWVLGWSASSLQPLPSNRLNDTLAASPFTFFLSSVWMSGSGPAVSSDGSLFFVTGNSDPAGSYDTVQNLSESLVKVTGDLSSVVDFFTPSEVNSLDNDDADFGAGGVLLLPPQNGNIPNLGVAAGKTGTMYLVDQQNLGGFTAGGPDNVVGSFDIGECWCAPSYFAGADGIGRVVSSGGSSVIVWKIGVSPVTLVQESTASLATGQDPGFFTTVSSTGTQAGTALIWAVSRPLNASPATVSLFAFDASDGSLVFSAPAGTWLSQGNANIVPVVAGGQVYVGSSTQLAIFGLGSSGLPLPVVARAKPVVVGAKSVPAQANRLSGTVLELNGAALTLETRAGRIARVDTAQARTAYRSVVLFVGEAITALGTYDAQGVLMARTVLRAKDSPALWQPDR